MSILKPSPKILEQLKKQELSIRKGIVKADIFSQGVKTKFWQEISSTLEEKLKRIEGEIENEVKLLVFGNDRKLIDLTARKQEIEGFLSIKDYVKGKEVFKQSLEKKQDEIEEYEKKLADTIPD